MSFRQAPKQTPAPRRQWLGLPSIAGLCATCCLSLGLIVPAAAQPSAAATPAQAPAMAMPATSAQPPAPTELALEQAREIDLDGLRGLGPATTRTILRERERQAFKDWAELMRRVPGIGPHKAAQLSQQGLRVQGQAYEAQTGR